MSFAWKNSKLVSNANIINFINNISVGTLFDLIYNRLTREIWHIMEQYDFDYYIKPGTYYIKVKITSSCFDDMVKYSRFDGKVLYRFDGKFNINLYKFIHYVALSNRYDLLNDIFIKLKNYEYRKLLIYSSLLSEFQYYTEEMRLYLLNNFIDSKYISNNYLTNDDYSISTNNIKKYTTLQCLCVFMYVNYNK